MLVSWLLIAPVLALVLSPALRRRHHDATRNLGDDRISDDRRDPR